MVIYECDRCGAIIHDRPDTVTLNVFQMMDDANEYKNFELCPDCFRKLKDFLWVN